MTRPVYLDLFESKVLEQRTRRAFERLRLCDLCPRDCRIDREYERGSCGIGRLAVVSSAFAHHGEERCLRGSRGSGTIFFSGCNLHCGFCQNHEISWEMQGAQVTPEQLAEMMIDLQQQGCHNLNLVTPSHVVAQILEALCLAIPRGFRLPVVYNSSGYDRVDTLRLLEGVVDIYMPDIKFSDDRVGERLTDSPDYASSVRLAVKEMHRQVGDLQIDSSGLAVRGLLIRHLVLPGDLSGTRAVMDFLVREVSPDSYVNLMGQYRPAGHADLFPELRRRISSEEFDAALTAAREAGIHRFDRL